MQAQQCAATLGLSIAALTKQASGQENSIMVVVQVFPLLLGGREGAPLGSVPQSSQSQSLAFF